jgi:MFS family permease
MEGTKKSGVHYAFAILVATCCFYAAGFGLISSISGVYLLPVSTDIGVGRGDFALWMAAMGIGQVVTLPLWGRILATTKNFNLVMTIGCLLELCGLATFVFATELWMFIIGGAIIGVGVGGYYFVGCPMLINNWFGAKNRGKFLGIAAAFVGVAALVGSPIFTLLIQNFGWRTTYTINLIIIAVLCLPMTIFVLKRSPEDKGLKPYGYDPSIDETSGRIEPATKVSTALKTPAFWVIAISAICMSIGLGYTSNQPGLCIEKFVPAAMDAQTAAMVGASMISVAAAGNVLGKILFGALTDKFGLKFAFGTIMVTYMIAMLLWIFVINVPAYYVAAFLLGLHNTLATVFLPLTVRKLYGNRNFARIYSRISMGFLITGPFATTFVGWMYQANGNYDLALWVGVGLVALLGATGFIGLSFVGKIPMDDTGDEQERIPASA